MKAEKEKIFVIPEYNLGKTLPDNKSDFNFKLHPLTIQRIYELFP